jgi:hypothetical protein
MNCRDPMLSTRRKNHPPKQPVISCMSSNGNLVTNNTTGSCAGVPWRYLHLGTDADHMLVPMIALGSEQGVFPRSLCDSFGAGYSYNLGRGMKDWATVRKGSWSVIHVRYITVTEIERRLLFLDTVLKPGHQRFRC